MTPLPFVPSWNESKKVHHAPSYYVVIWRVHKATRAASKYFERRAEIEPWLLEVERRFQTDFAFDNSDAEAAMEELSLLSEDIAERRLLVDRHRRTV